MKTKLNPPPKDGGPASAMSVRQVYFGRALNSIAGPFMVKMVADRDSSAVLDDIVEVARKIADRMIAKDQEQPYPDERREK